MGLRNALLQRHMRSSSVDETKDIFPQLLNGIPLTFPEKEWNSYSELARSFVGAMLCHDPERRLSPLGCLVHPWLERNRQQKSNKVGAHGRVSKLLFSQEPYERFRSQRTGLLPEACAISSRFKSSLEVKRCWKIAYLTVAAVNRFDWVVHPDPDMKYTCSRSQQGGESKSRISDVGNFEKMNEKSYDSNMQDLDLGTWGSDSEDDSSLGVSFLSKSEIDEQRSQKLMKEIEAKKQQVNLHADGPRKVQSWDLTKRKDELNEGIDDGTRKSKIRKKILRVLSPETEKRLGPVRKLSRKLGLSSADNKKTSAKLSEEASADFDLELKELNVLSLHDDEIQGLDDIDDHDMSAPASLFGKKHKHLMKLSRNRGMPVSPMTPRKKTSSKALFH